MMPDDADQPQPLLDDNVRELLSRPAWEVDQPELLEVDALPPEPPPPEPPPPPPAVSLAPPKDDEPPPPLLRILEAMLFIGGDPLTLTQMCDVIHGLTPDDCREAIETLNRTYRAQGRPYSIVLNEQGYLLNLRPRFASVRERLHGSVREARLSPIAVEVLSLVAYRQPATRQEIDAVRGSDSSSLLRQLVRHGLIALKSTDGESTYVTTQRFLDLFHLRSLDELPQTQDLQRL